MMNYNYLENMTADIKAYIDDEIDLTEYTDDAGVIDRDRLEEDLQDALWIEDSVTGNASGSYTCNSNVAKEYVLDNMAICTESLREFCVEPTDIAEHFLHEDWEYFDVTIRCYLLGAAIADALDEIEESTLIPLF